MAWLNAQGATIANSALLTIDNIMRMQGGTYMCVITGTGVNTGKSEMSSVDVVVQCKSNTGSIFRGRG